MHCRAHQVPVTPLTEDSSTATLSSLLTSRKTSRLQIKHERFQDGVAPCSMEESMESSMRFADDESRDSMETS